jgi:hypothetical protein
MKTSLKILLAAGAMCIAGMVGTAPASAASVGLMFRGGDVAVGYNDGYYDRGHRWHNWRNAREHRYYRTNYGGSYRGMRHDQDHDGIPDRIDRDRDGDGVSNYRDRNPNNPNR